MENKHQNTRNIECSGSQGALQNVECLGKRATLEKDGPTGNEIRSENQDVLNEAIFQLARGNFCLRKIKRG